MYVLAYKQIKHLLEISFRVSKRKEKVFLYGFFDLRYSSQ